MKYSSFILFIFLSLQLAAQKDSMHVDISPDSLKNLGKIPALGISYERHLEVNGLIHRVVYKETETVFTGKSYRKTNYTNIISCQVYEQGIMVSKTDWYTNGDCKAEYDPHFNTVKEWYPGGKLSKEQIKNKNQLTSIEYHKNETLASRITTDV
jgi:hypothetical protein